MADFCVLILCPATLLKFFFISNWIDMKILTIYGFLRVWILRGFFVCGFLRFSTYKIIVSVNRNSLIFFFTISMSFTCLSCWVVFARTFCTMLNRSDESVYVGAHLQHSAGKITIVLQASLSVFTQPEGQPDIHRS